MQNYQTKKLMIGIPGVHGVCPESQENIMNMVFNLGRNTDLQVSVNVIVKQEQFRARNRIVNAALAGRFDYLLMLDDDMVVPHDLPLRLLAHDKDVVGALYYQRGGLFKPVVMNQVGPDMYGSSQFNFWQQNDSRILESPGLYPVDVIGGGCMLFKTHVFEKIPRPWFEWEEHVGTDIAICTKARRAGYGVWVDTSIELGHLGNRQVITSRSIPVNQRMQSEAAEELGKDLEAYFKMPAEWIIEQMSQATAKEQRKGHWGDRGDDWESIKDYYQTNEDWHVLNLSGFNIWHHDQYRGWMLEHAEELLKGGPLLDYGPGVGILSIPFTRHGRVYAVEIKNAATLPFLRFRQNRHWAEGKNLSIWETDTPYPVHPLPEKMAGACCISVLNHLTHPLETMKWIRDQLKPGGFFVCDWALYSHHHDGEEPQHLDAYDLSSFVPYMHSLDFVTSPEHPWLFFYMPKG